MRPSDPRIALFTLPALLLTSAAASVAAPRPPLSVVVLSGQQAPNMSPGNTLASLGAGIISSSGQVGFSADIINSNGIDTGRGLFTGDPTDLRLAFRSGQPAPGIEGGILSGWYSMRFNAAGHTAGQWSFTSPGGGGGGGIWAGPPGALELIARSGGQAPDLPAGVLFNMQGISGDLRLTFGDGGHAVFNTRLDGPGVTPLDDTAIFRTTNGAPRLIAREGMTHPDLGPDRAIGQLGFIKVVAPRVNAHGSVAFFAPLTGPVGEHAMFLADDAGLRVIARTGQPVAVPGVPDARLGPFLHPIFDGLINNAGQVAFGVSLARENGESLGPAIVIGQPGGGVTVAARPGSPIANAPGLTLGGAFQNLRFGGAGNAAFSSGAVNDSGDSYPGIFVAREGEVHSAVLLHQPAGGLPHGYVMNHIILDSLATNARGQLIFLGTAVPPGPSQPQLHGLWAFDPIDGLFPITLAGDEIEIAPGDTRTVSMSLIVYQSFQGNTGGQDGFAGNLNDLGQVVFHARFTDGTSALFTTTIPTPAAGTLLALTATLLASRRRRDL